MEIEKITVSPKDLQENPQSVFSLLKETGVVRIPGFYSGETLAGLNREFESLLECREPFLKKMGYSSGQGASVTTKNLDRAIYPVTWEVYHAPFMDAAVKNYFGRNDLDPVLGIYFVKDVVGSRHHANDLHFDVERSLKFFIYLTDTSAKNGAFFCAPGSNKKSAEMRAKYGDKVSYDNRELSRELPVEEKDVIPIEGPAGTLIIFDTDVFHRAGIVHEGERRVMRSFSTIVSAPLKPKSVPSDKKSFLGKLFGK